MQFTRYLLAATLTTLCLQGCESFTPHKTFHGKLVTPEGETLKLGYGQPALMTGEMVVDVKTNLYDEKITSLSLQQGQTPHELPLKVAKPVVYGSFTLEPAEIGLNQRIEGNIKRQFVGKQLSFTDRKECTFSGTCKHSVEKEEKNCIKTGVNTEACTNTKTTIDEYSNYDKCPGWEKYESTYQDVNYQLTLLFFERQQDQTASAMFEGRTDTAREQTSKTQTKTCSDQMY